MIAVHEWMVDKAREGLWMIKRTVADERMASMRAFLEQGTIARNVLLGSLFDI